MQNLMIAQAAVNWPAGAMLSAMTRAPEGMHIHPDGHFSTVPPPGVEAVEVRTKRCFRTRAYTPGDAGLHRVDDPPRRDGGFTVDIRRWLAGTEALAEAAGAGGPEQGDRSLKAYIEGRKFHYELVDHFFGDPGVAFAHRSFTSSAHARALGRLRERLADPRWAASLPLVALAEATLLATSPDAFVTCAARRRIASRHP